MDFRKLEFGKADAAEESSEFPDLLINGYLDNQNLAERAIHKSTFLFLGYKGSGKTALVEHLRLSREDHSLFINNILLKDFPYKSFNKIIAGDSDKESKLPAAWDWLLLVYCIESLLRDQGATTIFPSDLHEAVKGLRNIGILPIQNIRDLVSKSSKNSFKIQLPLNLEYAFESSKDIRETDLKFYHIIDFLKKIICQFKSASNHLVLIDGLDEILTSKDIQYQSLAALIEGTKSLNSYFRGNSVPIKIVLLCRTDLFERLPHPNKNKIRQDSAFVFDWYDESTNAKNSNLIKLATLRAQIVFPQVTDILKDFFPATFEGPSIYSDLLAYTRHTPRDFLQLLKHIQNYCKSEKVTNEDILNGVKSYSLNYFLPEIKDELVGYLDFSLVDNLFRLLSLLRKRDFYLREAQEIVDKHKEYSDLNLPEIFNILFECSAIGHIYRSEEKNIFNFKYRNRNMTFTPSERIVLHKGVWKSLNLPDAPIVT